MRCALFLVLGAAVSGAPAATTVEWWQTSKDGGDRLAPQSPLSPLSGATASSSSSSSSSSCGACTSCGAKCDWVAYPDAGCGDGCECRTLDGHWFQCLDPLAASSAKEETNATRFVIDEVQTFQRVHGFGGAFTQAAASVWQGLATDELRAELIEAYFGATGIGYTTGRVPIHSCDFSPESYTFDDVAGDYALEYFDTSIAVDANRSIPFIAAALAAAGSAPDSLKLFASPWSPPAWMKDNNQLSWGGSLTDDAAAAAWALYFDKWLTAYEARGVALWGVTVQNEPEGSQPWESCIYTPETEASFVADHLGPALRASHPDVKIIGYDHNKDHLEQWADALFEGAAAEYVDGIGFHWYSGACTAAIEAVATKYPDKLVLATEACYELSQVGDDEDASGAAFLANGTWSRGEGYGAAVLGDMAAGAAGWTDWNLLLDAAGGPNHVGNDCDAAILSDGATLYYHPQFWCIGASSWGI